MLCPCIFGQLGVALTAPNATMQLVRLSRNSCALQDRKMHGIFRSVSDGALNINPTGTYKHGRCGCAPR